MDDQTAGAAQPRESEAESYASETFLPEIRARRSGVALCLSGGGFRAALFHLGALRRLNEVGALSRVDTITSVSGGSIIAAHLAQRIRTWPAAGSVIPDWDRDVASPFRAFTSRNLRTLPILVRLLPWNLPRPSTAVRVLARLYASRLVSLKLGALPARPRFVFCATDLVFGCNWVFESDRVGDYEAGYVSPPPAWKVARAVAASSCFPPIFDPMPIKLDPDQYVDGTARSNPRFDRLVKGMELTDGGVYDNLGLEPVWKTSKTVLVSDGGAPFDFAAGNDFFWHLSRYTGIEGRQSTDIRKRWLISNFLSGAMTGTYWGIASSVAHYGDNPALGYPTDLVDSTISHVRTDLDAFTDAESAVLENHGYFLAEAALRQHASWLISESAPPPAPPHPKWLDETRVRTALATSSQRTLLGRF